MKVCIACGMPMKTKDDYAMGDVEKDYCIHCANEDGTMHSYEEKLASMIGFIVKTQGVNKEAAKETAQALMKRLPAWNGVRER